MSSKAPKVIQGTKSLVLVLQEGVLECHPCQLVSFNGVSSLQLNNGLALPVDQLAVKSPRKLTMREEKIAATSKTVFTSNCVDVYLADRQTPAYTIVQTSETDWSALMSNLTPSLNANFSTLAEVPVHAGLLDDSVKVSKTSIFMHVVYFGIAVAILILVSMMYVRTGNVTDANLVKFECGLTGTAGKFAKADSPGMCVEKCEANEIIIFDNPADLTSGGRCFKVAPVGYVVATKEKVGATGYHSRITIDTTTDGKVSCDGKTLTAEKINCLLFVVPATHTLLPKDKFGFRKIIAKDSAKADNCPNFAFEDVPCGADIANSTTCQVCN